MIQNAVELLEAAERAASAGGISSPLTVLLGGDQGSIRVIVDSDWPLESLQAEQGASMAFRVSRQAGRTAVHARSGNGQSLRLEANPGQRAMSKWLSRPAANGVQPLLQRVNFR